MIKCIFKAYNPAGTFLLSLSMFYHNFSDDGDIAFLLMLILLFYHLDTILVFLFVLLNLNLCIKIPNWMSTIFHRLHACKFSVANYVIK